MNQGTVAMREVFEAVEAVEDLVEETVQPSTPSDPVRITVKTYSQDKYQTPMEKDVTVLYRNGNRLYTIDDQGQEAVYLLYPSPIPTESVQTTYLEEYIRRLKERVAGALGVPGELIREGQRTAPQTEDQEQPE